MACHDLCEGLDHCVFRLTDPRGPANRHGCDNAGSQESEPCGACEGCHYVAGINALRAIPDEARRMDFALVLGRWEKATHRHQMRQGVPLAGPVADLWKQWCTAKAQRGEWGQ